MRKVLGVLCMQMAVFAQIFPTSSVILERAGLITPQQVVAGHDEFGKEMICISEASDGQYHIVRYDNGAILVSEAELGSQKLSLQGVVYFGCSPAGVFFQTFDPVRTLNGRPLSTLMIKSWAGQLQTLIRPDMTFTAMDPVAGKNAVFTYVQGLGLYVRDSRASMIVSAQPSIPGTSIQTGAQTMFMEFNGANQTPKILWNNFLSADKFQLSKLGAFCETNSGLQIAGADQTMKNGLGLFKVEDGLVKVTKGEAFLSGSVIDCLENSVQTYASNPNGTAEYSLVSGSGKEQTIYSGNMIGDIRLGPNDRQYPGDESSVYVATSGGALAKASAGKVKVLKSVGTEPVGASLAVVSSGGRKMYVQNEGSFTFSPKVSLPLNRAYWLYEPEIAVTEVAVKQGEVASFCGNYLTVGGIRPTFNMTAFGKILNRWSTSFDGSCINVEVPADLAEGSYVGEVNVQGISIPVTMTVISSGARLPVVNKILRAGSFVEGPVSPRMSVVIQFSGVLGREERASKDSAYALGGVQVKLDGVPMRLFSNDGHGQVSGIIPTLATLGGNAKLTVEVDGVVSSASALQILSRTDELFTYDLLGLTYPVVMDEQGKLVGPFNSVTTGSTITAYGTGCGDGGLKSDDNQSSVEVEKPPVSIGGQTASVKYSGQVEGFVGLCQYNIVVPSSVSSGQNTFVLAGQNYNLFIK